ncbi:flagellar regulatory protein FleQ [Aquitalea magnusonii]|uniref:Flagellar regulatory protein FleQ n=1 Tax=Aquitalea magnusonii TaxID=332411 RepID=A0A3G9GHX7_9NEIS|nr:sigma 54-interacting transcriptional regulator [Aquitalea magnusonii]BBF85116.1 flagellar regulatory protein FleQ [Aquitalea magnusonii]
MSPLTTAASLDTISRMLDELDEPRIVITEQFEILHANPAYQALYGQVVGQRCHAASHGYQRPCNEEGESCPLQMTLSSGQPERVLHIHRTAHGEEHVDVELMPLADISGHRHLFIEKMQHLPQASSQPVPDKMVGRSPAFRSMLLLAQRAAPSHAAVLLIGESGTGKEGLARAIHQNGGPAQRPFIAVDCASLTETLLESELFGYEKGAFTGAQQRKQGLVEAADGGTLFLDEIGDLPLSQQVKLLRLLESGSFRRVGGISSIPANFRLIAATHRNLQAMVAEGSFRADLFYRLAVFPIRLPPLRERREDIPLLATALLERVAPGRQLQLDADARQWLVEQAFPGNIRELRNLLERASLLTDGDTITPEQLRDQPWPDSPPVPAAGHADPLPFSSTLQPLAELEAAYLQWAVTHSGLSRKALAQQLQITERTLYRHLAMLEKKTPAM